MHSVGELLTQTIRSRAANQGGTLYLATTVKTRPSSRDSTVTAQQKAIRVVLADDHPVVLGGLKSMIQSDPTFEVLAACADGPTALQAIQDLQPDLAILDISMPGLTGVEVLVAVNAQKLKTRIIFLTATASDLQIVEAVAGGAYGLMLKDAAAGKLLECMRAVLSGRHWLPPELVKTALEREDQRRALSEQIGSALTSRERETIILVAEGQPNKEIARRMGITEGTVKIHLHNIYHKLKVSNRTALAAFAHAYRDYLLAKE